MSRPACRTRDTTVDDARQLMTEVIMTAVAAGVDLLGSNSVLVPLLCVAIHKVRDIRSGRRTAADPDEVNRMLDLIRQAGADLKLPPDVIEQFVEPAVDG